MAVIKLLTAIFNGYCCAIQVNWKEKTNLIEKDMKDVIQSIQTELDKVLYFSSSFFIDLQR